MVHIISKPTQRELHERLEQSKRETNQQGVRGRVRTTEEAHDVQRRLERESGEAFVKPFAVSGDAPESKQAERELMERAGIRPEDVERYQARRG